MLATVTADASHVTSHDQQVVDKLRCSDIAMYIIPQFAWPSCMLEVVLCIQILLMDAHGHITCSMHGPLYTVSNKAWH